MRVEKLTTKFQEALEREAYENRLIPRGFF